MKFIMLIVHFSVSSNTSRSIETQKQTTELDATTGPQSLVDSTTNATTHKDTGKIMLCQCQSW